jgi:hypothetical protein
VRNRCGVPQLRPLPEKGAIQIALHKQKNCG